VLIGEKICLGPILDNDAPNLFSWLNDRSLAIANGPYRPMTQAQFDQWFSSIGPDMTRVVFAIRAKADMRLIGYVQLINIQPIPRSAEIGILIGARSDQDQGFGTEAMRLAIEYGWRDLNLHRLCLFVVGDNPRAVHIYEKLGFEIEGAMRQAAFVDEGYRDITIMGVLRPKGMA
jgi:RimJ/RimL family protein N-acetyltransferase